MTTYKKSTGQPDRERSAREQAERLSRDLGQSAHQVWLAGVGAFGRAQAEGTRLFENLAREGANMEDSARKYADSQAEAARTTIESNMDEARRYASGTWERLERSFEDRVRGAMVRFGVPSHDDVADLTRRVDALTAQLRKQEAARTTRAAPRSAAAAKKAAPAATRSPTRKTAARKASPRKAAAGRGTTRPAKKP